METLKVEILNPKAKNILKGLADLNLINIKRERKKSDFTQLLAKLRKQSDTARINLLSCFVPEVCPCAIFSL